VSRGALEVTRQENIREISAEKYYIAVVSEIAIEFPACGDLFLTECERPEED
jgi:hypothetical protein